MNQLVLIDYANSIYHILCDCLFSMNNRDFNTSAYLHRQFKKAIKVGGGDELLLQGQCWPLQTMHRYTFEILLIQIDILLVYVLPRIHVDSKYMISLMFAGKYM